MGVRLVIFDMDGTLTEELLDFAAIRREIGLPEKAPIIEGIAALPEELRRRGERILDAHEMSAAAACKLHDGAAEVLEELRRRGIQTALLTRNSARCAAAVLGRHALTLDFVASREDLPHKPHPDSILNLVRRFGVERGQTLMVGDYLYDIDAATAAGVRSVLLCMRDGGARPAFAATATYCVDRLDEVLGLLE